MPSWIMHLQTANNVAKKLKIEAKDFIFSNILPDVNSGWVISSNYHIKYEVSHFGYNQIVNNENIMLPGIDRFISKYKNNINDNVFLGYYTHLLTDYFWNKTVYTKYNIYNSEHILEAVRSNGKIIKCNYEDARIMKQSDFRKFETYLLNHNEEFSYIPSPNVIESAKNIEEIEFYEKEQNNALDFLKKAIEKEKNIKCVKYQLFTEEELIYYFNESIKFIIDCYKDINIIE